MSPASLEERVPADRRCTLVVLFNHPFPKNIDKLRAIYGARFPDMLFLMPIVEVDDPSVITVFRGGFNFHGHIADAIDRIAARDSDFYLFCQDDLLLNPALTPASFWETVDFGRHDGFIPEPESFSGPGREGWPWNDRVLSRVVEPTSLLLGGGVEDFTRYLPPPAEAGERFARYGITAQNYPKAYPPAAGIAGLIGQRMQAQRRGSLPYPLAVAFSDCFALRRDALRPVARYLGLFAAMDLFVEVAVATAMILGCRHLATLADTPWRVSIDWTNRKALAQTAPTDLQSAYRKFDEGLLYMHPIKLSSIAV